MLMRCFIQVMGLIFWLVLTGILFCQAQDSKPSAKVPETIRIGLFTLFQPRTLSIKPILSPAEILAGEVHRQLQPGKTYRVRLVKGQPALFEGQIKILEGKSLELVTAEPATAAQSAVELELTAQQSTRRVTGKILIQVRENALQVILTQSLEDAVAVVTASEMKGVGLSEALKCQAIVVRSFLMTHLGRHQRLGYDVCDSTHCQLYFGTRFDQSYPPRLIESARQATHATHATVLWEAEHPVTAYYTACCGGHTTVSSVVWPLNDEIESTNDVPKVICNWCRGAQFYRWQRRIAVHRLLGAMTSIWRAKPLDKVGLQISNRTPDGIVTHLTLADGQRTVEVANGEFRSLIGRKLGWNLILSNVYQLTRRGDFYEFTGHGFGHQVGLCVAGTVAQAKAGRSYQEILRFYFPQATLVTR
ncbi:MAG: SpoIID/LytB domain-containing protein [Acidobacteria bacterium]|nr:SpoIID/LytB domain-containing protein [Acidobacteriota bacterium]